MSTRRSAVVRAVSIFAFALAVAARASASTITGTVIDQRSGVPIQGLSVAVERYEGAYDPAMAGDAPASAPDVSRATTGPDGSFAVAAPAGAAVAVAVYGGPRGYISFHGVFASKLDRLPVLRLIVATQEERRALAQINAFRVAPGGAAEFGTRQPLVFDQNLVETARYWAALEKQARRIGHTCAELANPAGCVEFNAYFHRLPGAPPDDDSGQNAAFDSDPSWSEPNHLFEIEGKRCGYNWRSCPGGAERSSAQTGHYVNLMSAQRWIGLGQAVAEGYGAFFAQNLL